MGKEKKNNESGKANWMLPMDAMLRFSHNMVNLKESYTYADYLQKNGQEIEKEFETTVVFPTIDRDSIVLRQLCGESSRNAGMIQELLEKEVSTSDLIQLQTELFQGVEYLAFVPLPALEQNMGKQCYTVLGSKHKIKAFTAGCLCMLLSSMYLYFEAQQERSEHQKMYFSMLSLMISVIDAKDPVTAGHSQRVANISRDIGIWLKLNLKQQNDLEFTALLHDIGKIGVSDYILNKPSVYTQDDFEQMKHHTVRGAEMLAEVGIDAEMVDGVRHHHERMDGRGYPDGLTGDELSLFAKIIKIADVFDALTSKRQYKEAWKIAKALDIIYQGRGTEFDTEIADVFIEHMRPVGWTPPVQEQSQKFLDHSPMLKQAASILNHFYQRYCRYIFMGYPIPSRKADSVTFDCRSGFMDFDWGETFNNTDFLEKKPVILSYERETESLFFGQCTRAEGVLGIYYYFFRGFLNMGLYLLKSSMVPKVIEKLHGLFGEPFTIDSQMSVFMGKKYQVIYYHTYDDKDLLCYISDYLCSNYVFGRSEPD